MLLSHRDLTLLVWAVRRKEQQIAFTRESTKRQEEISSLKDFAGHGFKVHDICDIFQRLLCCVDKSYMLGRVDLSYTLMNLVRKQKCIAFVFAVFAVLIC